MKQKLLQVYLSLDKKEIYKHLSWSSIQEMDG